MSDSKKDIVLNSGKKAGEGKTRLLLAAAAGLVLLSLAGTLLVLKYRPAQTAVTGTSGSSISFPTGDFYDGKARYYSYDYQGTEIKFFLLKSSDGVVRAAFDACDVCYPAQKGYRQEGDYMVCNNCGQRFASLRINEEKGGCNPSPLQRSLVGDMVVIAEEDLIQGASYF